jgi:hypothetical protein
MRKVTWFTVVYKKKAKFMSILTFKECNVHRHMDKMQSMVHEKMDPHYSYGALVHNNPLHANLQLVASKKE